MTTCYVRPRALCPTVSPSAATHQTELQGSGTEFLLPQKMWTMIQDYSGIDKWWIILQAFTIPLIDFRMSVNMCYDKNVSRGSWSAVRRHRRTRSLDTFLCRQRVHVGKGQRVTHDKGQRNKNTSACAPPASLLEVTGKENWNCTKTFSFFFCWSDRSRVLSLQDHRAAARECDWNK